MKPVALYSALAACVLATLVTSVLLALRCESTAGQQERFDALKAELGALSAEIRTLSERIPPNGGAQADSHRESADSTLREARAAIDRLLSKAAAEALQPKSNADVVRFSQSVEQLTAIVPADADATTLGKLATLEWEAEVFWVLYSDESRGRGIEEYVGALNELLVAVPSGAPKPLTDRTEKEAANAEQKLLSKMRFEAVTKANHALEGKAGVLEAWSDLDRLQKQIPDISKEDAEELSRLAGRLQKKLTVDAALAARDELKQMLVPCLLDQEFRRELPGVCGPGHQVDRDTKLLLLSRIAGAASEHLAALHTEGIADRPEKLEGNLIWIRNNALRQAEKTSRMHSLRYQSWAIENITRAGMAINHEDNPPNEVLAAMEEFLFVVDPALLDIPVAEFYRQTFDRGWRRLEKEEGDENSYLEKLASSSILTTRRGLNDYDR